MKAETIILRRIAEACREMEAALDSDEEDRFTFLLGLIAGLTLRVGEIAERRKWAALLGYPGQANSGILTEGKEK